MGFYRERVRVIRYIVVLRQVQLFWGGNWVVEVSLYLIVGSLYILKILYL